MPGFVSGIRFLGYLLMLVFVLIVVLFLAFLGYIVLDPLKTADTVGRIVAAAVFGAVALGVWMLMRVGSGRLRRLGTPLKPYRFTCHLRTLPGVVGGWFKADVEIEMPSKPESHVTAVLSCFVRGDYVWEAVYVVRTESPRFDGSSFRMSVPVVFFIPADPLKTREIERSFLVIAVKAADGCVYRGTFRVPIFDTTDAPAQEQEPEQAPTPKIVFRELPYDWGW